MDRHMCRTYSCRPSAACSQVIDRVVAFFFLFPEGKVFLEKFDDALGVTEVIFFELIDFVEG